VLAEIPNEYIMSANLDVLKDIERFSVCQSFAHEVWARLYSSRLEVRFKYSPGNNYETFAFPEIDKCLQRLGGDLPHARRELMTVESVSLLKSCNCFNTNTKWVTRIEALRALQREMDSAVAHAYDWEELNLQHSSHEMSCLPESDCVRFIILETTRAQVSHSLLELSRQLYEEEVAQKLHGNVISRTSTHASLDFYAISVNEGRYLKVVQQRTGHRAKSVHGIVKYLIAYPDWYDKVDDLAATSIIDGQWNTVTNKLLAYGHAECQGERREARSQNKI